MSLAVGKILGEVAEAVATRPQPMKSKHTSVAERKAILAAKALSGTPPLPRSGSVSPVSPGIAVRSMAQQFAAMEDQARSIPEVEGRTRRNRRGVVWPPPNSGGSSPELDEVRKRLSGDSPTPSPGTVRGLLDNYASLRNAQTAVSRSASPPLAANVKRLSGNFSEWRPTNVEPQLGFFPPAEVGVDVKSLRKSFTEVRTSEVPRTASPPPTEIHVRSALGTFDYPQPETVPLRTSSPPPVDLVDIHGLRKSFSQVRTSEVPKTTSPPPTTINVRSALSTFDYSEPEPVTLRNHTPPPIERINEMRRSFRAMMASRPPPRSSSPPVSGDVRGVRDSYTGLANKPFVLPPRKLDYAIDDAALQTADPRTSSTSTSPSTSPSPLPSPAPRSSVPSPAPRPSVPSPSLRSSVPSPSASVSPTGSLSPASSNKSLMFAFSPNSSPPASPSARGSLSSLSPSRSTRRDPKDYAEFAAIPNNNTTDPLYRPSVLKRSNSRSSLDSAPLSRPTSVGSVSFKSSTESLDRMSPEVLAETHGNTPVLTSYSPLPPARPSDVDGGEDVNR